MPIFPSVSNTPYDLASSVLNAARFRLNDKLNTLVGVSGKILEETDPSTNQAFNNGYRRFQDALCDAGCERFQGETIISSVPYVQTQDPAILCSLSWFNMFDGHNNWTQPVLPGNLILPLWMSERPSGNNSWFPWPDIPNMTQMVDGLPMQMKQQRNGCWEWRGDAIYFPGALVTVDFRVRYRLLLPDILDSGTTRWFQQTVPLMRCQDALAWWICAEFASARAADGNTAEQMLAVAASCKAEAMNSTRLWANRDAMQTQRADVRRIPYGQAARGSRRGYLG